jgi:hypothetical protein
MSYIQSRGASPRRSAENPVRPRVRWYACVALAAAAAMVLSLPLTSLAEAQNHTVAHGKIGPKHQKFYAHYRRLYGTVGDPAALAPEPPPALAACRTAPEFCPGYFGSNGP